jgi:hypothetical protein
MKTKLLTFVLPIALLFFAGNISAQSDCAGSKTFTQGGWGADANGNNPGTYLQSHFAAAFGANGLTIGSINKLKLSSANAVNAFLPSGTAAAVLPSGTKSDPGSGYRNVLAGQLVALTLNVVFDAYDESFSVTTCKLGDQIIGSGAFKDKKISEFLALANEVIGGSSTAYALSDINDAATKINENFDNGTVDNGYLICPLERLQPLAISVALSSSILCHGDNTGAVASTVEGGLAPYTYLWSNGSTSGNLSGVAAGTYSVVVTDSKGTTAESSIVISEPDQLIASSTGNNISCFGNSDGTASVTILGGTAPYVISWSNGGSSETISGLAPGIYVASVTDANGCSASASVTLTQPDLLEASAVSSDVLCFGSNEGTAEVSVKGGTAPYSYVWSNGSISEALSGLVAGSYSATVTDAHGCTTVASVTIAQPELLVVSAVSTNVTCFGNSDGTAVAAVKGGTAPYVISWTNGSEKDSVSGLDAGTYVVSVTDAHGCSASTSVTVTQPELLQAAVVATNVVCYGSNDGTATVTATGGTAPYTYSWSNGGMAASVSGLAPGSYNVIVLDAHNCSASAELTITQPAELKVTGITTTFVTCDNGTGTATVTVVGGTAPYRFNWIGVVEQSSNVANLPLGTWQLVVTDAHGCSATSSATMVLAPINLTTATPGGWGAKASGTNWGAYLDGHFTASFPAGLTVGSNGRFVTLSSTAAIHGFLPSSGTPAVLKSGTQLNPTSSSLKNTLVGHTVALVLNIAFDKDNTSFGASSTLLKDMIVGSGKFMGWSVTQIAAEANKALGATSTYALADLTSVLTSINQNYDNGTVNLGFLVSPCSGITLRSASVDEEALVPEKSDYPILSVDQTAVTFTVNAASKVSLNVYDLNGQLVGNLFNGNVNANENKRVEFSKTSMMNGLFVVRLVTETGVKNVKVMMK